MEEIDLEGDGDTERTTASIKSANTPTKNPFDGDDDIDDMEVVPKKEKMPPAIKEHSGDGRVKRFLNEIKSNCKTADTVVESMSFEGERIECYLIKSVCFAFLQWNNQLNSLSRAIRLTISLATIKQAKFAQFYKFRFYVVNLLKLFPRLQLCYQTLNILVEMLSHSSMCTCLYLLLLNIHF